MTMQNKNVLITGSSRGIGLAIAHQFGLSGANIIINCSRSTDELATAESRLKNLGINVCGAMGDLSDYKDAKTVMDAAAKLGDIDILVNCAGVSHMGLFTEMSFDDINSIISRNIYPAVNMSRLILPSMIRRKEGKIINISSIWGVAGASCEVIYSAAKGFINTFTKALAREAGPSNIFVNAIACGVIDTRMNDFLNPDEAEELKNRTALIKFGSAYDVARLCLYLAETDYMTGQILTLDGGMI